MDRINIIGLGGIGSYLSEFIIRYVAHSPKKNSLISFVDGDEYETKNLNRQIFTKGGKKAKSQKEKYEDNYSEMLFQDICSYVNEHNIEDIIKDGDITFVCVDNHKTRNIISNHAKKLNNCVIISGGNEYTDGNAQMYIRKDGIDITPSLTDYHPEILNYTDRSPEEMSCEELSKSSPQLIFANITAAIQMCWLYYNMTNDSVERSEVYFDGLTMCADSKNRKPKN